jgi:phage anti-repressor protein
MLSVDCFKTICMLERSEFGKQTQRYYLDVEKIFKKYMFLELDSHKKEIQRVTRNHREILKKRSYHTFDEGILMEIYYLL